MKSILNFTRHLLGAMLKGFFFTGIAAAILCAVVLLITEPQHQVTLDVPAIFALVISGLAAILGAAVALIYHLSHLEDIQHAVQRYSGMRAAQRQKAGRE
jgi:uncharacterized membrane protein